MAEKKEQWFPRILRTDEFRENLEPGFGAKANGTYTPGGIPIIKAELRGRSTLGIYHAIAGLDIRGHTATAIRAREEINALLDEIDNLRTKNELEA